MTDRDRLIELLNQTRGRYFFAGDDNLNLLADHLLANGVFILPEDLRATEDFSISAFIEAMQMYKEKDRYIKIPCEVGGTVYCLIQGFDNPLKATVNRITVQVSGVVISCSVLGYFGQSYMATDFGKTVFLTKEEAEKALATDTNVGNKKELGK